MTDKINKDTAPFQICFFRKASETMSASECRFCIVRWHKLQTQVAFVQTQSEFTQTQA